MALLTLTFTNGEVKVYDVNPLLDKGIFRELQNIGYFRCARIVHGTVEWQHEQGICPDTLYETSVPKGTTSYSPFSLESLKFSKNNAD